MTLLIGGSNSFYDDVYGDAYLMDYSTGGDDTITGGVGSVDRLAGDAFMMTASTGGNDTITGGSYSNTIWGDAWIMFSSIGGNDNLTGSGTGSTVYGGGGYMESSTGGARAARPPLAVVQMLGFVGEIVGLPGQERAEFSLRQLWMKNAL